MTIFMISDLKQQKIGFQEKIVFKKNIYTTQSELGFIFQSLSITSYTMYSYSKNSN